MPKIRLCATDGCGNKHYARGFCYEHYYQWRENHAPRCKVVECSRPVHRHGHCGMHAQRFAKTGNPLGLLPPRFGKTAKYFRQAVLTCTTDDCLIWPFARDQTGYAVMSRNGKRWLVHRAACFIIHGRPPQPDLHAAHSCGAGDKGCVNPRHLSWKTAKANHGDRIEHGTHLRGETNWRAKLTEADVLKIRAMKDTPHKEIAAMFGISRPTVSEIQNRRKWAWLD